MEQVVIDVMQSIILSPGISIESLLNQNKLTENQLDYILRRINEFLEKKQLTRVIRTNNRFYINTSFSEISHYIEHAVELRLTEEERVDLILILLNVMKNLSLNDFIHVLGVSKNTATKDIASARYDLNAIGLTLDYSRQRGYYIHGDPVLSLNTAIKVVNKYLEKPRILGRIFEMNDEQYEAFDAVIAEIEAVKCIGFSGDHRKQLMNILKIVEMRDSNGIRLESDLVKISKLVDVSDFSEIVTILARSKIYSDAAIHDVFYIVVQVLGSKWVLTHNTIRDHDPLYAAIIEMVDRFETTLAVSISNHDVLYQKLYQHIVPAIYRTWYGLAMDIELVHQIIDDYRAIHEIVRLSIKPIEMLIEAAFDDSELAYITILLVSSLFFEAGSNEKVSKAIVVCESGTTLSHLLYSRLQKEFPTIDFKGYTSKRDFLENNHDVDMVFSTLYLDTDIPLFILQPTFDDAQIDDLRSRVEGLANPVINSQHVNDLIRVIEKHTQIDNQEALLKDIYHFLGVEASLNTLHPNMKKQTYNLSDLIEIENVWVVRSLSSYQDALTFLGNKMCEDGVVSPDYIARVQAVYEDNKAYFQIAQGVFLPHASNDSDVMKASVYTLLIREGVVFPNENAVAYLVFFVAPLDNQSHVKGMSQLHDLVLNQEKRDALMQSFNSAELKRKLGQFIQQLGG